ncbi:DNA polymerase I [Halomonadaceae bacterium LMG 33818]|uniref:DNA polymerase I n=1 Tax=Cernens ardua TaxID=3402176 RepID=UPI003EDB7CC9
MSDKAQPPFVFVDGSAYLYRAFHALPPLTTSSGQPTGAVRGVVSMLKSLIREYPDSPIAVVFDAKGKTFRDDMYDQYKAHRPPMPDDMREQIEPLHACVRALGLPLLSIEGVEADDVIGTLAYQATGMKRDAIISTGDKDMAQLVNEHITLVNTMKNEVLDVAGVEEKFGIPPSLIVDYLALMGDSVDNIPGVPGVGNKTALAMLQGYGAGLKTIYEHPEKLATLSFRGAKSMAKKLADHREQAFLSYDLATIRTDCDLPVSLDDLSPPQPDNDALLELYRTLEFRGWLKELENGESETTGRSRRSSSKSSTENRRTTDASSENSDTSVVTQDFSTVSYKAVHDQKTLDTWIKRLNDASAFCFDLETTSLNYMQAEIVGIGIALVPGEAIYIPVGHSYIGVAEQLDREAVLEQLAPLLSSENITKIGQNLKYDIEVLARYGVEVKGPLSDTMLESYVLNSTANRHDMDTLALAHLGHGTISFEEVAGKGAKQITFDQVELDAAVPYACEDVDVTLRLHDVLRPRIDQEGRLSDVLDTLETPLIPVLSRIERNGVRVDATLLAEQSRELESRISALQAQAYELAGREFNLGSPKQLGEILFEEQKLPVIKKTPKGAPSTAEAVLEELALDYPLPKLIMEHRGLSKLKSTYTDKLPQLIDPATGRIHTSYHQAVTATGRLSSSDPNLQNIPVRTEEGRKIRRAFVARPGYVIVAADYSQIELRIMAHLSGDKGLLKAFAEGRDIHAATAAEVFGVSIDKVTSDQRRSAKAINFGLIYGMSAWGLAKQLHIDRTQAQTYIDRYFHRYPGVADFMESTRALASEQGYVETVFGRRLYVPDIHSRQANRRQAAERTAINAPMQGTAADIIKRAMINVDQWLNSKGHYDALMVMQVHDELVFEVAEGQQDAFIEAVRHHMQEAGALDVDLLVEARAGANWEEAH